MTVQATPCPQCGASIAPQQDWCLECGAGARTRMVPTPNWRLPIIAVLTVLAIAVIAFAFAFVSLTADSSPTTTAPVAPVVSPVATAPATTPVSSIPVVTTNGPATVATTPPSG